MNFNDSLEFLKDRKYLGKRYRSLDKDIARLKKVLAVEPLGTDKHFAVLFETDGIRIAKARFFCESLKGKTLRIVYAYSESKEEITFIELYYKGDQDSENKDRVREFIKQQNKSPNHMTGQNRDDIKPGVEVDIVLKADQGSGELTRGIVAEVLTNSQFHPHGIKVRLQDGQVGRVQNIIQPQ